MIHILIHPGWQHIMTSSKPVMFQIASNFNCHENASMNTNLFNGYYLTNLAEDLTQGPSAASGAGAGAIVRLIHHYKKPINLLEHTDCHVRNGKLIKIGKKLDNIQIGLHTNITTDTRIIDQVFTSTIQLDNNCKDLKCAEILLKSAYDGTYLSAIYRQTEKLVLTLIGGGVFNNPLQLIFDSVANSHIHYAPLSSLKEVILPLYNINIDPQYLIDKLISNGYAANNIKVMLM